MNETLFTISTVGLAAAAEHRRAGQKELLHLGSHGRQPPQAAAGEVLPSLRRGVRGTILASTQRPNGTHSGGVRKGRGWGHKPGSGGWRRGLGVVLCCGLR